MARGFVGRVVCLILTDTTVVADSTGRWRMLPTDDDVKYRVGNTVEATDDGVIRVLSEDPIKYVDLPTVDDSVIAKFKSPQGTSKESFEDFGGLLDVVERARELIEVPLIYKKELTTIGARPIKGVLFTGLAATNRPQDIDAALRRPGRFDWEVNFPLPNRGDREAILRASARKLSASETLPHRWVAQNTEFWSAAELKAIWSEAALLAVNDQRSIIVAEDYIGGFERVLAQRRRSGLTPVGGNAS